MLKQTTQMTSNTQKHIHTNNPFEHCRKFARKHSSTSPLVIIKSSCGNARLIGNPLDLEMTPKHTMPYVVSTRRNTSANGSDGVFGNTKGNTGYHSNHHNHTHASL